MRDYNELLELHKHHNPSKENEEAILNSENMHPFNSNLGMVFTCHKGQMKYLKYTLSQYRKIEDMFIVGAYDSREVSPYSESRYALPYPDIWYLAHMWVTKHYTWGGFDKRHGWLWLQIYASSILKRFRNIKYIFSANGDCAWENPEGVYDLINDVLGNNDLMAGQSYTREQDGFNFIHTCSLVFKRDAYFDFIDFIVWKIQNLGTTCASPEDLIQQWVKEENIKFEHAPIQPLYPKGVMEPEGEIDLYAESGTRSTWKDYLGFINIEAEKNWRCSNKKEPLNGKYFDLRDYSFEKALHYSDHDKRTLCRYYITGDYRYIKMWWDQDPVSISREERKKRMRKTVDDY